MGKLIVIFSMFSYKEYMMGISNTNSHIFNWLKKSQPNSKLIFVDFNRYGFFSKLKYFIKYVVLEKNDNKIYSKNFNVLNKVADKTYNFRGYSFDCLFDYLNNEKEEIEIWSFNPFIKNYQLNAKKYFYTIDDWRKNRIFKKFSNFLEIRYKKIPEQFDKVFVNNKSLIDHLYNSQNNIYFVPNGVDVQHYRNYDKTDNKIKQAIDNKLKKGRQPLIGYMGVISPDRVDFELCEFIIKHNPNMDFVFAGPVLPGFHVEKLKTNNNVKFIGTVFYDQLPYLFSKFDVCIIPHKFSEFIQSMDPKKLYEYLAAGKPIVSTPVSGTENFRDIIYLADNKKIFSEYIKKALGEINDQLIEKRIKVALSHDWQKRFNEIEFIIRSN